MTRSAIQPTGVERRLAPDEIIVSKTNLTGHIQYANRLFLAMAGYTESECLGKPHSMIRHPEMPRAVFRLLWKQIESEREVFAYVKNLCKNGDHYWVFAHVTPTFDDQGKIVGYHSNRRCPSENALRAIRPLYERLLAEEKMHENPRDAAEAGFKLLEKTLAEKNLTYDEFIFTL